MRCYDCKSAPFVSKEQAGRLRYGMSVVGGNRSGGRRPPVAQASRLHLDLRVPKEQAGRLRYGMSVVGGNRSGGRRPPVAQASRLHLDPRVAAPPPGDFPEGPGGLKFRGIRVSPTISTYGIPGRRAAGPGAVPKLLTSRIGNAAEWQTVGRGPTRITEALLH